MNEEDNEPNPSGREMPQELLETERVRGFGYMYISVTTERMIAAYCMSSRRIPDCSNLVAEALVPTPRSF
jgi:hypothetical protein